MDNNSVKNINKKDCCGCTACMSICPQNAIHMEKDEEGFLYPVIEDNCVNCGLCLTACKNKNLNNENQILKAYAAKHKDNKILKKSTSGGVSRAISEYIINSGGIVYGVVYDSLHKVIIEKVTTIEGLEKIYGSKYVQSDPKKSFTEVYNDLQSGKKVLYIATSCYISGLKSYLHLKKTKLNNLYTIDLICHGTPSPKLFEDYINFLKRKYDFSHFEFRTKKLPWGYGSKNFGCTIYCKNGKEITDSVEARLYLNLFFSNYCLRPYCYNCEFTSVNKPADITIADYWGCNDEHPDFFDIRGVSAVLVHNEKGAELLKKINTLDYIESSIEKISKKQLNLKVPSSMPNNRNVFWDEYKKKGFKYISKKYGQLNFKGKIARTKLYKLYVQIRRKKK